MRDYPALKSIARIIKVLTAIGAAIGAIASLVTMSNSFLLGFSSLLGVCLAAVLSWAVAESILVVVNMGVDIAAMREAGQKPQPPAYQDPSVPAGPTIGDRWAEKAS